MTDGYDGVFFGEAFDRDLALAWAKAALADTEAPFAGAARPQALIERHAPALADYMRTYAQDEPAGAREELGELGIAPDDTDGAYAAMAWKAYAHWDADMDWSAEHFRERGRMDPDVMGCCADFVARHPERPGARPGDDAAPPAFTPYAELGSHKIDDVLSEDLGRAAKAAGRTAGENPSQVRGR